MRQLPSFNGWRAVSVLMVLFFHLGIMCEGVPSGLQKVFRIIDGKLGVQFFFTISGFLITWMMLREESKYGQISLKNFYFRRILRIFPVYFSNLIILIIFQMVGLVTQQNSTWVQLMTFTRNFYFEGHNNDPISFQFWSLAIEEQFYLFWPIFFLILNSLQKRVLFLAGTIFVSIGVKIGLLLGLYSRYMQFLFEEHVTWFYLDYIAYGCMGAILLQSFPAQLEKIFQRWSLLIIAFSCFMLAAPEVIDFGKSLQSLAFIFLLLQSVLFPQMLLYRVLNWVWVAKIGIWSYSIYVWQQIIFMLWPFPKAWFLTLPLAILAGWISYRIIERPFLNLRKKYGHSEVKAVPSIS